MEIDFILLPSVSSMHIFTGGHVGHKQEGWAVESDHQFLDSLVVRISACHVEGPGSIPGRGGNFFHIFDTQVKYCFPLQKFCWLLGGSNP